jgi:diguanylate cyclase (GGDEF)-like protein
MLFNRRRIEDILENELKEGKRYKQPITCLMIDVDDFKHINDLYGHKAGDSVLREIAQLIKLSLREVDILARWGGDEFVAILPQTDKNRAIEPASRIIGAISIRKFEQIPSERVTVSIGIASASESIDTDEKLINAADFALFEAKRKGRNRIEVDQEEDRGSEKVHSS